jgi:hypothetical protein
LFLIFLRCRFQGEGQGKKQTFEYQLSTTFQLYRGGQFHWWGKPEYVEKTTNLSQKLLKLGYDAPRLKSSLQKFSGRHHNMINRYEISISQIT